MHQVMLARLVFFEPAKAFARFVPHIIVPIVADPADFAADGVPSTTDLDTSAFLTPKLMIRSRRNTQALTGLDPQYISGAD